MCSGVMSKRGCWGMDAIGLDRSGSIQTQIEALLERVFDA